MAGGVRRHAIALDLRRGRLPGPDGSGRDYREDEAEDFPVIRFDAQARAVVEDDLFGVFLVVAARQGRKSNLFFAAEETHDGRSNWADSIESARTGGHACKRGVI